MTESPFPLQFAQGITLRTAIFIGLDESLAALEESFTGLTDQQFRAAPIPGRHNIVTLVEHCIQGLDLFACEVQGMALTFEPDPRFDIGPSSKTRPSADMPNQPTVAQELARVRQLREAIMAQLQRTSDEDLFTATAGCWWFEEQPDKTRADSYMRCIWHTMAHLKQIWLLRGALGGRNDGAWPQQHWA
ncbi:MAG: hypothetical protein CMJ49_01255 [Planctomycetaceae bacterium]|nr:hypothetical protein [Planctomycetaceae bacterium]